MRGSLPTVTPRALLMERTSVKKTPLEITFHTCDIAVENKVQLVLVSKVLIFLLVTHLHLPGTETGSHSPRDPREGSWVIHGAERRPGTRGLYPPMPHKRGPAHDLPSPGGSKGYFLPAGAHPSQHPHPQTKCQHSADRASAHTRAGPRRMQPQAPPPCPLCSAG